MVGPLFPGGTRTVFGKRARFVSDKFALFIVVAIAMSCPIIFLTTNQQSVYSPFCYSFLLKIVWTLVRTVSLISSLVSGWFLGEHVR